MLLKSFYVVLKTSLRGLFKSYGEVLDVVAHSNLRMRGQAFVSFASADIAKKAMKEVRGFPLYSKPMVCDCFQRYIS
jgi:U2 small nuclear ribonucleoprotein B''